ncbi:hypothetical protein N7454_003214 [Penicillium verhagenii]|nr:hypothetical protein N7454_003214 [Penicillium verhagenii]
MRNLALLSLALAAISSAQNTTPQREDYKAICKAKPPQTSKTFNDGYEISYVCDSAGSFDAKLPGSGATEDSSEDCAMSCKSTKGCKASDWFYNTKVCNLYSDDAEGDEVIGSVLMLRVTPEDDDQDDSTSASDPACEKDLQTCLAQKDNLGDDLDECNDELAKCKTKSAKDAQDCTDKLDQSQQDLDACEEKVKKCTLDPVWERRKEAMEICGHGGRTKIQAGKYAYTAHCQRQISSVGKFYRQAALSVDQCLAECSKDPKCKSVHYVIMNDAHCKFMPAGQTSAFPVGGESDCSRSPMIGFAPTTPK